jgi:tetratricopeptide (TPR) repeat protein
LRLYARRGGAYQARGDPDHAMLDFNGRWGSIRRIRQHLVPQRRLRPAIADYDEAIQLDPKDAQAYYDRGMAWEKKRRLREALADFKMHSQLAPSGWP